MNKQLLLLITFLIGIVSSNVKAQVNAYAFTQSNGVYTPITGGTVLQNTGTTSIDEETYPNLDIGFTFNYADVNYTKFGIGANGFIVFGTTISNSTSPLSTGTSNNVVSALGSDLFGRQFVTGTTTAGSNVIAVTAGSTIGMSVGDLVTGTGIAAGSLITALDATTITLSLNATSSGTGRNIRAVNVGNIRYETIGSAPNRKLIIQWNKFSRYATTSPSDFLNFQIILEETTNKISITYDFPFVNSTTNITSQVGLRGAANSDFNNRSTATNWSSTVAGTANNSNVSLTPTVFPTSGLTFTWTPPACSSPSNILAAVQSTTSVNITWNAASTASNGYEYFLSTSSTTPLSSETPTGSTTNTNLSLTNLNPSTSYFFWIRSNCGSGNISSWSNVTSFFTGHCLPSTGSQLSWVSAFSTTAGVTNFTYSASTGTAGGYNNQFSNFSASNFVGGTTNISMTAGGPTCGFAVWIDWNNNLVFETTERVFNTTTYVTTTNGSFSVPTGTPVGTYRMRVVTDFNAQNPNNPCATLTRGEFVDFAFNVVEVPNCFAPTGLTNAVTSLTSASHSWVAPTSGTPVGYEWIITTSATPPTTNGTSTTLTSATSTGLQAETTYFLHVRTDCGNGSFSSWATSSFFTGYCLPASSNQNSWVSAFSTTGGTSNFSYTAASGAAGGYTNQSANFAVSSFVGGTTNLSMTAGGPTCGFAVWVDWNNNLVFETTERVFNTTGFVTTTSGNVTVPAGTPNGSYRMRVVVDFNASNPNNPCGSITRGQFVDFTFNVVNAPTCFTPLSLVNTPISLSSASHSWSAPTSGNAPVGYEWFVSTTNTPPASGTATTSLAATSTGLSTDVTYYLHVRSNCGDNDFSGWATSSFILGYCVPTTTFGCTDGDVIARVVLNTLDNNSGTGCPSGTLGYSNYTTDPTLTTTLQPATTYNLTVFAGQYSQGYAAWIDYNDDGIFDNATERVGFSNGLVTGSGQVGVLGSSATFPIVLTCTPPTGQKRMRIRGMFSTQGVNVTPCTSNSYGETEDYLITITTPPTCPSTGLISTVSTASFTADLSFNLGCATSTSFDFEYGPVGFTPGTGTLVSNQTVTINGTTATYTLSGLQPLTAYEVRVRANCGNGDVSSWSNATPVTTLDPPCAGAPDAPSASLNGITEICDGQTITVSAGGFTTGVLGISNIWETSSNNIDWTPIAGATGPIYTSSALSAGTVYFRVSSTCENSNITTISNVLTLTVNALPVVTVTVPNNGVICGTQTLTASGADTYSWSPSNVLSANTGTAVIYTGTISQTVNVVGTDANGCASLPASQEISFTAPEAITPTVSVPSFCATGGASSISVSSDAPYTYTFQSLGTGVITAQTSNSIDVTVTETSNFRITGTDATTNCMAMTVVTVSVFPLPTSNITSSAQGVCPGTTATINTGLTAQGFTSNAIPFAALSAPVDAVTLVTGGVATPPTDLGFGLDDAGWSAIPIGFGFNFFGTIYNTVSIGTNGTVFMGNTGNVGDFTFTTLPSTTEPFNMIAVLAMDNNPNAPNGGTIQYWTEGTSPNRKFVVNYDDIKEFGDERFSSAQAIFYETTGIVEVHVEYSTNIDRNKLVGINNGDGTQGVLAYASGTVASATNPITNPFAYRFSPPANFTVEWSTVDAQGNLTQIATGTNLFSLEVTPTATTTYDISYTNQTTGCTNALGSSQITINVLGDVAPSGLSTISTDTVVCPGVNFTLSTDYVGSVEGLTFQWQISTDGVDFNNITGATSQSLTTSQVDYNFYRLEIKSCNGTPSYSASLEVTMDIPTNCYCVPDVTFGCEDGDVIARVILNTLDNNSGSGCPSGAVGYNDYTTDPTLTTTLVPGVTYNCTVFAGDWSGNYAAWIDYNDDGIFDNATERIGFTTTAVPAGQSVNFPVVVSCNPPSGVHRLRVRNVFATAGANITPCGSASFGETEDYLITIDPAPVCAAIGTSTVTATTTTSTTLTWSMGCSSATNFDVEYGAPGFTQGTGTLLANVVGVPSGVDMSYDVTGLTPNSTYQFYVRANCGNGDVSPWTLPVNASTPCAPVDVADISDVITCDSYTLPAIVEVTPSNNNGLVLGYFTQPNGGGTQLTGNITTSQTIYIRGVAGACSDEEVFTVTINNSTTSTATEVACSSFTWNGTTYTTSGVYIFNTVNAVGCDSVATLNLTINQPTTATLNVNACQSFTINNQTYTTSGSYIQNLTNVAGCDSTLTINVNIGEPDVTIVTEIACDSYSWNGTTYTTSGVYTETLQNIFGCDSVVTLNLTINNSSTSSTTISTCDSYTWNGETYTASGTYDFITTNAAGCDSTATLILTIGNNESTTSATTCGSFTWTNGETYTASGIYNQTLVNAAGCDSVVTLNLTILPLPTATATDNGAGTLTSSAGASYQWINCATNAPIAGATSQTFSPEQNGSYAVTVTNSNGCSATSTCVVVDYIGLDELSRMALNVYPNPTTGEINIAVDGVTESYNVTVEDMNGRLVMNLGALINTNGTYQVNMTNLITGVYFIKLNSNGNERVVRVIKQ